MEKKQFDFHEIKTFEDACRHLGISEGTELLVVFSGDMEAFLQANAFYKLKIIQKAIQDGDFSDKNRYRFYPFWTFYKEESIAQLTKEQRQVNGIRCITCDSKKLYTSISRVGIIKSPSHVSTHLNTGYIYSFCFDREEAARYVGRQFENLFFQYYGIKVKE